VGIARPGTQRYAQGHKIYIGSGSQSSVPYVLFGVVYCALRLGVPRTDCGCVLRYPALLDIVQGAGS
jgi:hypothetical protein